MTTLQIGGAAVTSSVAELNLLDGVTSTTAELNILDGVTSTATELNLVDGSTAGTVVNNKAVVYGSSGEVNMTTLQIGGSSVTSSVAELNLLDGVTATTTELNYVDGVTSSIQTQLNAKATLASPTLTGTPSAPTASASTNTTQIATTAYVTTALSNLLDGAPTALDTLNELAAAINDDASYASTVTTALANKQATITGAATTIVSSDLTASRAMVSDVNGKIAISEVTSTELGYLDGVTSSIQTQLDSKLSTSSGAASTIASSDLTAERALVSNASGKVAVSYITTTELGYLDGVTSAIQSQLDAKQGNITGSASTIVSTDLAADRVLVTNNSQKVAVSYITTTELGYLDGVTSAIQTQIDAKQGSITAQSAIDDINTSSYTLADVAEKINSILAVLRTTGIINT